MPRSGTAILPLHHGKAPAWLFRRMAALSREILTLTVAEFGADAFLRMLSDPWWFQALGSVLGFDWHSSGLTTTVTGALKEGIRGLEGELGVHFAGGKGAASRKTPEHILLAAEKTGTDPAGLVHASRMAAKVDNAALQDGYQLYHHVFVFTTRGSWAVIQQGMNPLDRTARRYHWLSEGLEDFVVEPHRAVCSEQRGGAVLNMTARESRAAREAAALLGREEPERLIRELTMPARHNVDLSDLRPERLRSTFLRTYENQPQTFQSLLGLQGVGPKTVRALALLSELLFGAPASVRDPARFSFAHGGKDGTPYPVDRETYDGTIGVMKKAIRSARVGNRDKVEAFKRLHTYFGEAA
jgi:hypothetical protein